MMFLNKLANWYFTRRALPYWMVLLIDCLICYLSGLFVFWLYYRGAVTLGNLGILTKTILMYMVFNLIGFRIFRTYFGIIRYSSFVDLMHVAMAQGVSLVIAEVMHYVVYSWQLQFVRLEGRQIVAMYVVATIGMMIFRVLVKTVYDVVFASDTGQRTLIYGVRDGGAALAKAIRNEKPARFLLKGFISHDKKYDKHRLMGVSVYPADERLGAIIEAQHIKAVLVSSLQVERFRNDTHLQDLLIGHGVHIYMEEPVHRFQKNSSQGGHWCHAERQGDPDHWFSGQYRFGDGASDCCVSPEEPRAHRPGRDTSARHPPDDALRLSRRAGGDHCDEYCQGGAHGGHLPQIPSAVCLPCRCLQACADDGRQPGGERTEQYQGYKGHR